MNRRFVLLAWLISIGIISAVSNLVNFNNSTFAKSVITERNSVVGRNLVTDKNMSSNMSTAANVSSENNSLVKPSKIPDTPSADNGLLVRPSSSTSTSTNTSSSSSNSSEAASSSTNSTLSISSNSKLRDQLLGNIIKNRLEMMHFSQKEINEELSEKAFNLYIDRIDPGKQFLLQEDVNFLSKYKKQINEELVSGDFVLMKESTKLLKQRIGEVSKVVEDLLKAPNPFDFNKKEFLESDPKKRKFSKNKEELTELWRKILKYNVLNSYLTYVEEAKEEEALEKEKDKKDKDQKDKKEKGKEDHKKSSHPNPVKGQVAKDKKSSGKSNKISKADKGSKKENKKLTPQEMEKKAIEETLKNYRRAFLRRQQEDHDDDLELFFNSVAMVFDPHTNYMPPQKKEDFDIDMKGTLDGIGALLREDGPYIKVVRIIPGSASWKQKQLGPEDTILKVGQGEKGEAVDVVNMRITDAVKLIRGPRGTKVRLTIKRPTGEVKILTITRDVVQIEESYAKGALLSYKGSPQKYGYIYLPKFYRDFEAQAEGHEGRNCTDDVRALIDKFNKEKVSGIILDLRNNGGGALEDARLMSGLFINKGPVVQVRQSKEGKDVLYNGEEKVYYNGPLVVLINRLSASASEIVAAALQDYGRAVIIGGDHSHGKGTVQLFLNLDQGLQRIAKNILPLGALKITIQKFYRVTGGSTQFKGVIPDIILPDPLEALDSSERYLEYSLRWDEVKPLTFDRWNKSLPLTKLINNSKKRVLKNDKFIKLQKSTDILKKRKEDTLVALNITDMRTEQDRIREENKQYRVDQADENIEVFKEQTGKFIKVNFPPEDKNNDVKNAKKKKKRAGSLGSYVEEGDGMDGNENGENDWSDSLRRNPYIDEAIKIMMDLVDSSK